MTTRATFTETIVSARGFGGGYLTVERQGTVTLLDGVADSIASRDLSQVKIGANLGNMVTLQMDSAQIRTLIGVLTTVADYLDRGIALPDAINEPVDEPAVLRSVADRLEDPS